MTFNNLVLSKITSKIAGLIINLQVLFMILVFNLHTDLVIWWESCWHFWHTLQSGNYGKFINLRENEMCCCRHPRLVSTCNCHEYFWELITLVMTWFHYMFSALAGNCFLKCISCF